MSVSFAGQLFLNKDHDAVIKYRASYYGENHASHAVLELAGVSVVVTEEQAARIAEAAAGLCHEMAKLREGWIRDHSYPVARVNP